MKRLRDMEGDEPLFRRGVEVLQGTPPTAEVPDVKQRVWRSINAPATHAPATMSRRLPILIPKLALVAIVALGAGTAGAVIAHRWQRGAVPARDDVVSSPPRSTLPPPRPAKASPSQEVARPAAAAVDTVKASPRPRPPAGSAPKKLASLPPSAASVARERTEVLDALVALRREHDPVRAGTLLARYLSAHPRGALREEALVLAIEAADARADQTGGARLAHAYQAEFPAGRFLPFARSHTDGHGSH
jgi:hypothetical protein